MTGWTRPNVAGFVKPGDDDVKGVDDGLFEHLLPVNRASGGLDSRSIAER